MKFFNVDQLISQLTKADTVIFLLRHAERRHITLSDPHFGALVGITPNGEKQAQSFGASLPATGDALYFSSPVGRCKETAAFIAKGRKDTDFDSVNKIPEIKALGNMFVKNIESYTDSLKVDFYKELLNYFDGNKHPAFYPLQETVEKHLELFLEKAKAKWNFFLSHDAWVMPFLVHYLGAKFSKDQWMNFLSGLAITKTEDKLEFYAITGLENGYLSL